MIATELEAFLTAQAERVDRLLRSYLPARDDRAAVIHDAVAYSLLGPGKRVRPILCLHVAEALGADEANAAPAAVALELIHAYSLVHDDLPSMDDDDERRGRPTTHKVYGEAMAILAGDAMLTLAFEVLSRTPDAALVGPLVAEIARAAGIAGMVGGQVADIEGEGQPADAERLRFVHRHKTMALLRASVVAGAIAGRASAEVRERLSEYGEAVGLSFQVADDILDVVGAADELGKAVGKDAERGKLTYPGVHGLERSREIARELNERARAAAAGLPGEATLVALADFIVERSR